MFNYDKLKSSAYIMLAGIILATVPVMSASLIKVILEGATFDWRTPAVLAIGAFSTWIAASAKNFIKNK